MKERGRKEKREKDRRSREKGKDRRGRREGEVQGQAKWMVKRCDRRIESHSDNRNYKKCR